MRHANVKKPIVPPTIYRKMILPSFDEVRMIAKKAAAEGRLPELLEQMPRTQQRVLLESIVTDGGRYDIPAGMPQQSFRDAVAAVRFKLKRWNDGKPLTRRGKVGVRAPRLGPITAELCRLLNDPEARGHMLTLLEQHPNGQRLKEVALRRVRYPTERMEDAARALGLKHGAYIGKLQKEAVEYLRG